MMEERTEGGMVREEDVGEEEYAGTKGPVLLFRRNAARKILAGAS